MASRTFPGATGDNADDSRASAEPWTYHGRFVDGILRACFALTASARVAAIPAYRTVSSWLNRRVPKSIVSLLRRPELLLLRRSANGNGCRNDAIASGTAVRLFAFIPRPHWPIAFDADCTEATGSPYVLFVLAGASIRFVGASCHRIAHSFECPLRAEMVRSEPVDGLVQHAAGSSASCAVDCGITAPFCFRSLRTTSFSLTRKVRDGLLPGVRRAAQAASRRPMMRPGRECRATQLDAIGLRRP